MSNPFWLTTYGSSHTITYNQKSNLDCLTSSFEFVGFKILSDNIYFIDFEKNEIVFYNDFTKNKHIEPLETLVSLINKKSKIDVSIKLSDDNGEVLLITCKNLRFIKIINSIAFNADKVSMRKIHVKFYVSNIQYENLALDISEKRKEKLIKIKNENIKEEQ